MESGGGSGDDDVSPPSSPIIGYSKDKAAIDSQFLFCFNCKGPIRLGGGDNSFDTDSLICRRQIITTLENFNSNIRNNDLEDDAFFQQSTVNLFFNKTLDPNDSVQCRELLLLARKNIHCLQILSNPKRPCYSDRVVTQSQFDSPWNLRKETCKYFNFIVRRIRYFRSHLWNEIQDLDNFFQRFVSAFGNARNTFENYLKSYTGQKCGNENSSALYHYFHMMLDIRWYLLVIYGFNKETLDWILDDLVYLAWVIFTSGGDDAATLKSKLPFNCWCVKELWTMIRLTCEEININFWNFLKDCLQRLVDQDKGPNGEDMYRRTIYFPLWLIIHLAQLGDYNLSGSYKEGREKAEPLKFNGYYLINAIVKEWTGLKIVDKHCEINKLLLQLTHYWGFDLDLVVILWQYWFNKMEKFPNGEVYNPDIFSSVEKWNLLIARLCTSLPIDRGRRFSDSTPASIEIDTCIARDSFLSFLKLLVSHANLSKGKEWKKLKSHIGMNFGKNVVGNFGEIAILRVSTLYLSLASSTSDMLSMCDRLKEILQFVKQTTAVRTKAILRACATAVYILIQKSVIEISKQDIATYFMGSVNALCSQSLMDTAKKDNVMIYLELLDTLPNSPPFSENNLERDFLISPNLTMWLSSCSPNYLVRTFRVLVRVTNWIISSKLEKYFSSFPERDALSLKIFERTTSFLIQAVIINANRVSATDVEPMANLAADLTLFSHWNSIPTTLPESFARLFDHFALNERTCPVVSQFYINRLITSYQHSITVTEVKWCQSWIRLNILDRSIPEELNERILGTGFSSTSNDALLERWCTKSEEWSRGDVQNVLQPLVLLTKAAVGGQTFKESAVSYVRSIVKSCRILLKHMEFEKLYIKGDTTSIGHLLLNFLAPSIVGSWEKLSPAILSALKRYMFNIFEAVISYPNCENDPFLRRKMEDLVIFAFLGYIDSKDLNEDHPGTKILMYSEDHEISLVLNQCIPRIIKMVSVASTEQKLKQRFVQAVAGLRTKGLTTSVIRFLPGILSIFIDIGSPPEITNACCGIIIYCCNFGLAPFFSEQIIKAFDSVMTDNFAFKSKRFFDLASTLIKTSKQQIKKFVKVEFLRLLEKHVGICEKIRGERFGNDHSLRTPLDKLEREILRLFNDTIA